MMILADLLEIPMLKNTRVTAGASGLKRTVHSVNMMDSPDIFDYLRPHELVLTTAYAIKDQPDILVKLVTEMAAQNCAGIGIKTKRYIDRIPDHVKEVADRLHVPLLELSLDCSIAEALHQLLGRIMEFRTHEMRHALESHRKLSDIILEGKSLQQMMEALSNLLGLPVLLIDSAANSLAQSHHFEQAEYRQTIHVLKSHLPSRLPEQKPVTIPLLASDKLPYSHLACYPVQTYQPQGYLLAFTNNAQEDSLVYLTVEQAVNVISFELLKQQAVKERSRRYKYDFFSDVIDGLVTTEQEILHRGRKYGLKESTPYLCASIKKDPALLEKPYRDNKPAELEKEQLYDIVKQQARVEGLAFLMFVKQDGLVMLLPQEATAEQSEEAERVLEAQLHHLAETIWTAHGVSISIGIGNAADRLTKLPKSYGESQDALQTGYNSKKRRFVQFFHVKEFGDLLRLLPPADMTEFIHDTFRGLLQLDTRERRELQRTLRAYYDHHCHIADTAKQLFVHRNTVIYRLEKCEQLTGRSLRSISDSLRFRVAFQMADVLGLAFTEDEPV
ncbi:purine catabolism regulator [Paenibacillus phyllosphaerae]|uniref:Purine catabolism regulator n=1 Tax=Paenibacillus phyllosphaerae TaxID=274593 RepID=A0A7W5AWY9_9BACL|nr:PucR family transcriptional regulator [Paenibacillus phyllosphaerae]MBB3110273.1 purine catabolism regulator [Paenibacillus phyllosphaerae]